MFLCKETLGAVLYLTTIFWKIAKKIFSLLFVSIRFFLQICSGLLRLISPLTSEDLILQLTGWHCAVIYWWNVESFEIEWLRHNCHAFHIRRGLLCYMNSMGNFHNLINVIWHVKTTTLFLCPHRTKPSKLFNLLIYLKNQCKRLKTTSQT